MSAENRRSLSVSIASHFSLAVSRQNGCRRSTVINLYTSSARNAGCSLGHTSARSNLSLENWRSLSGTSNTRLKRTIAGNFQLSRSVWAGCAGGALPSHAADGLILTTPPTTGLGCAPVAGAGGAEGLAADPGSPS